jgi:hypothetical protein
MFFAFMRTLVRVAVASLIVGTILAHFGITADQLVKIAGFSQDQIMELARRGITWALPNLLLGSLVIVPVWFLFYLFRPPGTRSEKARSFRARPPARSRASSTPWRRTRTSYSAAVVMDSGPARFACVPE